MCPGQIRPRVSVVMPTFFDQADSTAHALNNLVAQTLAEWELIIVIDSPPDATLEAVEPYLGDAADRQFSPLDQDATTASARH